MKSEQTERQSNGNSASSNKKHNKQQQHSNELTGAKNCSSDLQNNLAKELAVVNGITTNMKASSLEAAGLYETSTAAGARQPKEVPILTKIKMYSLLFLVLFLAIYCRDKSHYRKKPTALWPLERLLNYEKFKARYPRIQNIRTKPSEDSRRHLLFNLDLISLGRHNLAYIAKKHSYYMRQSPFKSDRTSLEQMDVLNQLDEFNLQQILEASRRQDDNGRPIEYGDGLDKPVRGLKRKAEGAQLENSNDVERWFKRIFKGDSYFDIPDYPLDEQPDPSKVTHIDSDLRYCSRDIHDQGSCGACYAFSWNSLAEWHYCRQAKKIVDFSEQHIVDCGYKVKLDGCLEGLLKNVRAFSQIYGFELEKNYPWKKKQGNCRKEDGSVEVSTQMTRVIVDRTEWEEILKEQPILLEVHLPDDILSYSRGVHPGHNCNKELGHGMLLIGYGREQGVPYWLLKNSMGKKWGENGYLRLSRDAPMKECFATGFITKFKFKSLPEENYIDFYDNIKFKPTVKAEETRIVDNSLNQLLE